MNQIRQRININKDLSSLQEYIHYTTLCSLRAMDISSVWLLMQKKNESTGQVRLILTRYYNELINQMAEHGYVMVDNEFIYTNHSPAFIRLTKEEKEMYLYGTLMKHNQQSKDENLISSMIERNRRRAISDYQEMMSFRNVLNDKAKSNSYSLKCQNDGESFIDGRGIILGALRENPYLVHDIDKTFFKENYYEIMDIIYKSDIDVKMKDTLVKYAYVKLKGRIMEDVEDGL